MSTLLSRLWRPLVPWTALELARRRFNIDLDGFVVEIDVDPFAKALIDGPVLRSFPRSDRAVEPGGRIRIRRIRGWPERHQIEGPASVVGDSNGEFEAHQVPERLIQGLCRFALDRSPENLHLHGMAVEHRGHRILSVAPSGSGKSTLCAFLAIAGTTVITDEMATIRHDGSLTGVRRPLLLRTPTPVPLHLLERDHTVSTIPGLTAIGCQTRSLLPGIPPRVVAVNQRSDSAQGPEIERLTVAAACRALIANSFDGIRLGDAGVRLALAAAAGAHRVSLTYPEAEEAARLLLELADTTVPDMGAELRTIGPPTPSADSRALDAGLMVHLCVDSVLVHVPSRGTLIETAAESAPWWIAAVTAGHLPADAPDDLVEAVCRSSGPAR